ncbi:terpene synthase [Ganoderma adspersum]
MAASIDSQDEGLPPSYLPILDMLAGWPWQRRINPLYEEVSAEGNAWLRSFSPFTTKSQHAFERCDVGLLASLVFPDVSRDQFRTAVDLQNIFFTLDEYTDVEPALTVRGIVDVCIDAMHNPSEPRPGGEVVLGEIVRQFWERGQRSVPHQTGDRFVAAFVDYMNAVAAQAEARDHGGFLTVDKFLAIRREDIGARPLYVLGALFLSVPDHFHDDPLHARMIGLGCDLIAVDNDMVSYNREQAAGNSDFNLITLAMHHHGLTLQDAARWLVKKNAELEAQFLQCHSEFSIAGGAAPGNGIQAYMEFVGNVRRAMWCWSFECGRYFGDCGPTYAKTQAVPLMPKKIRDTSLRGNQVDVFLMEEGLAKV